MPFGFVGLCVGFVFFFSGYIFTFRQPDLRVFVFFDTSTPSLLSLLFLQQQASRPSSVVAQSKPLQHYGRTYLNYTFPTYLPVRFFVFVFERTMFLTALEPIASAHFPSCAWFPFRPGDVSVSPVRLHRGLRVHRSVDADPQPCR